MHEHARAYLTALKQTLDRLPLDRLAAIAKRLWEAREAGQQVFLLGNGGSAATASHFACDLGKGTAAGAGHRFRAIALTDNIPLMTAWANDAAYADIFAEQLDNLVNAGDVVIGISASGNSENVLRAMRLARARGAITLGLTGFAGGRLRELVDECLVVPSESVERIEDVHLVLEHLLCGYLRGEMPRQHELLSIVIPVYNEEEVLPLMRERLNRVLTSLGVQTEVLLIDDGSRDRSADVMREFARADHRYKVVILSRNYGHQVALTAGLDHATGDVIVVLDADLQDPPELIPQMLAKWRAGYHVVYAERTARQGEAVLKRLTAHLFYRLIRFLSGVDIPVNVGDFRLMDRKVVDGLKRMPERFRFVRGMVAWAGFRQCPIKFERLPRAAGTTKYPWKKMMRFALDALFAFSVVPLRITVWVGLVVVGISMVEIVRTLYLRFVAHSTIPGFSAIFIAALFLGGLNLLSMGILGEYIGRIYVEAKGRPLYFVQEFVSNSGRDA